LALWFSRTIVAMRAKSQKYAAPGTRPTVTGLPMIKVL
jgi:hypothetical protein